MSDQSVIEYQGEAYTILYKGKQNKGKSKKEITATLKKKTSYPYPKIMYVPAERNFVSSIAKATSIPFLPAPLFTFLAEYKDAQEATREIIDLPVSGVKFRYNSSSDTAYILGEDYEVDLLKASSGFQSMTPLYLVTQYLSNNIGKAPSIGTNRLSLRQKEQLQKLEEQASMTWRKEWASQKLEDQLQYNSFINVVEELEQNLYPNSQKQLLFSLIASKNEREADRLVLTTHSLYLLGYLGLCIKAQQLKILLNQLPEEEQTTQKARLKEIIPLEAALEVEQLSLYQLNTDGSIENIQSSRGLPSEDNDLNVAMIELNDLFTELQPSWEEIIAEL